jgi:hypothetical protein
MDLKIRWHTWRRLKALALVVYFLSSLPAATGQTPPPTSELYGGIELSPDGIVAVVLQVSPSGEDPGLRLVASEVVRRTLAAQSTEEVARNVQTLLARLQEKHQVAAERIFLIGSHGLASATGLAETIRKLTGKTLTLLDAETEMQLNIVGTIPQRERVGATWIDNRNSSALLALDRQQLSGGYQLLRTAPAPYYDFVTMNLRPAAVKESLRQEAERKPGLLYRKRVYLTGSVAWALTTLLAPDNRQTFVPLTAQDIARLASKAARAPQTLLTPDLSSIRNRELRREVEAELEMLRNNFTPPQLVAGAELLKTLSDELQWQEKTLWFARFGHLGRIVTYLRLQAGK